MIFLIILIVAFCCCAAFIPMPRPLQIGLYIAAALVLLIILLSLAGMIDLPGGPTVVRINR